MPSLANDRPTDIAAFQRVQGLGARLAAHLRHPVAVDVCGTVIGWILLYAAVAKIANFGDFAKAFPIRSDILGLSPSAFGFGLVATELSIACALIGHPRCAWAARVAAVLFTFLLIFSVLRPLTISASQLPDDGGCGCFPGAPAFINPEGHTWVGVRNAVFLLLCIAHVYGTGRAAAKENA